MRINNYFKNKKSKKGLTLVEVLCAIFVLAIVFVGILNAVAFSRQMVFTNNSLEKASFKGQLVADEIFSAATGCDPDDPTKDPTDKIDKVINNLVDDPQNKDEATAIGKVTKVDVLTEPESFAVVDDSYIQYTIVGVGTADVQDTDVSDGTVTYRAAREKGWNITVRVFYREISGKSDFRCVDISAFAPFNYISES